MGEALRVLIVTAAEPDAIRLVRELQRAGLTSEWTRVGTPDELRGALTERDWDVVVADYHIPWPPGPTPLDVIRHKGIDAPYIVVSSVVGEETAVELIRAGANDFITWDHLSRLPQAIRREGREARFRADRRRAENELRQSEERYRRLFEESSDAIFVIDTRSGRFLDGNRAAERLTGRALHELRKLTVGDVSPSDPVMLTRLLSANGAPHRSDDVVCIHPDGTKRTGLFSIVHVDDDVVYATAHDVTERQRTDEALRALLRGTTAVGEEFFRALVRELALSLGADRVCVAELLPGPPERLRTIAVWAEGVLGANVECQLAGSPNGEVMGGGFRYYPSAVATSFPHDPAMVEWGVESYLGLPLFRSNGAASGLIAVLHSHPLDTPVLAESLVRIFAARVESELERLSSASALRREEEERQSLFSASPTGICTLKDRVIGSANTRMCELTGYPLGELNGLPTHVLYSTQDEYTRVREEIRREIVDTGRGSVETRWIRKDGTVLDVLLSCTLIDAKDPTRGTTLVALDITKRLRAEEGLRRLAAAIEQSEEGVTITDPEGVIAYVNPAFERITGYTPAEAVGQHSRMLKSGKQDAAFYQQLWGTLTAGRSWKGRFVNRRKDGALYTQDCSISPVFGAGGRIEWFVAAQRDVTKALRMEEDLRQSQRVESLGRLAAGVAHDFNNLLSPILGYSELLLSELQPTDERYAQIEEIEQASKRARDLTRQLLAFGRKQALQIRPVDLNSVATGIERLLRRTLREDVALGVILSPSPCVVLADKGQAEQVIMNLAVNAQDAMPGGGRLAIRIASATLSPEDCETMPGAAPGDYGVLIVADTGCGMDDETRQRIFEPFFSTKGERGTGLGLSTVYGIVTQHGGHVLVESEVGHGSTFRVFLPATTEFAVGEVHALPLEKRARASETVLLVEDNDGVRMLAETVLRREGYAVLSAAGGDEALALLDGYSEPVHLLLTDVVMSGMDGRELFLRVGARYADVKVLFMSGYTDDVVAYRGVLGADTPFVQKPFSVTALAQKVREVLGS
jgi:two-component system cell cycle sensor histidine kinase/response regulator CckA